LGRWLQELGLEQYETAFRENQSDDDADEAGRGGSEGIVHHGARLRRKLLPAIAELRSSDCHNDRSTPANHELTRRATGNNSF
jgi:hypothetical protein